MSAGLAPSDKLLGQILADRYQILHRLGEGAMGVVYKARHVKVGRLFAVKVLHPRTLQDAKVVRRFEREAELAGRLRHPNVIGVVDVGEVDGTRYMVMEFAEGPDLAKLLDEAPMRPERIIRLVRPMLDGLYHAHEQGLIHRDFKPENVIIERAGNGAETPRIVDFGIALLRDGGDSADGAGRLTTNGLVLGTPHYMAPEQAVADPIDHRIDLFALGIVIYEMLSGRLPFDGSGAEVARANLLVDPPRINQRVPHLEVDPLLEAFSRRLMAKKRTARPPTAKAARELLDLIEHDRAAAARQLGVPSASSGRAAATESVAAMAEPAAEINVQGTTLRMQPTPRPGPAVAVPRGLTTGPSQRVRRAPIDEPRESRGVGTPTAPPAGRGGTPRGIDEPRESRGVGTPTAPPAGRGGTPRGIDEPRESRGVGTPTAPPAGRGGTPRGIDEPRDTEPSAGPGEPPDGSYREGPRSIGPAAADGARMDLHGDAAPGWGGSRAAEDAPPVTELPPAGAAGGGFAPVPASPPAMAYAVALAPPAGAYGVARRPPHRDTALRTPMGWQTASLPARRRSWLIAGLAVGALSIVTATVLTLTKDDGEPSSRAHLAISGSAAVTPAAVAAPSRPAPARVPAPASEPAPTSTPPPASEPAPASTPPPASEPTAIPPRDPAPVIDEARAREPRVVASPAGRAGAPARDPRGDGRRPTAAPPRPRDRSPEPVSHAGHDAAAPDAAPGRVRERAPEVREPDAAAPVRPEAAAPARADAAAPARPEPPATATAISSAELGRLYDVVKAEIEQLPDASRQDLLGQLAMLAIMRAMTGSQQARDDAAVQLRQLRQRMRGKSGH